MSSIIGTNLDEIVRHVELLKPLIVNSIVEGLRQVVAYGNGQVEKENNTLRFGQPVELQKHSIENERSCLIQYILNFGQLLEQFLHNEDNCEPFFDAGGFDCILQLFPLSLPSSMQFLTNISCLSSPSVSTLHHSTTEDALNVACKSITQPVV